MKRRETGAKLQREMPVGDLGFRAIDENARTVELSFSSETPVERWFGSEILAHDADSVDLSRLEQMGVLLYNHSTNIQNVVGKVLSCEIDTNEHRGRAMVQFDDDEDSEKVFRKVASGTLQGVSVGYRVNVWEEVAANAKSTNGRFAGPCDIATRWMPYEITICPVPADASVGVGRSEDGCGAGAGADESDPETDSEDINVEPDEERGAESGATRAADAAHNTSVETREVEMPDTIVETPNAVNEQQRQADLTAERQRVSEINTLCRGLGIDQEMTDGFISRGDSMDEVRKAVLDHKIKVDGPVAGGQRVDVEVDAMDNFREAASHSLLLRAGIDPTPAGIAKVHEGARELRGMSLRVLADEYLRLMGVSNASRMPIEEVMKRVFTPDSQFAGILDATIGHSMAIGHTLANTTYQAWVKFASNPNFKSTPRFRMSAAGTPQRVNQNGEIQFHEMSDEDISTQVLEYAIRWAFTRQSMINDDLGMLTTTPMRYAAASQRAKNQSVYDILNNNAVVQYDAYALFSANHANDATTVGDPTVTTLAAGRSAMRKQTDISGTQNLNIAPKFLIVGVDIETIAEQLVGSIADTESPNANVINPFRSLQVISDADITDTNSWFLAADPNLIDTIEFTTLNGQNAPIIETRAGFKISGMEWRLIDDWGVTLIDHRGLYRNTGASA